jgi:PadR family transcriptional regulator, regulatory protein PadR
MTKRAPARVGQGIIPGTLDMLVLKAVSGSARHGEAITQWILERSGFELDVNDGSLYPALRRLERRGQLTSRWGRSELNRRARYYRISAAGRRALSARISDWKAFASAVTASLARTVRARSPRRGDRSGSKP